MKLLKFAVAALLAIAVSGCAQTYKPQTITFQDGDTLEKGVIEQGAQSTGAWKYTDAQTGASKVDLVHTESMPARVIPAAVAGVGAAATAGVFQMAVAKENNAHCAQHGCGGGTGTIVQVDGATAVSSSASQTSTKVRNTSSGPCGKAKCPTLGKLN